MTSLMMTRDSMTSYTWSHNLQGRRIWKLVSGSTIRVDPISVHYRKTLC